MPTVSFTIATFNMNLGRGDWNHLLDSESPDIVLAQESHDPLSHFRSLFDAQPGQVVWRKIPEADRGSAVYHRVHGLTEHHLEGFEGSVVIADTQPVPWSDKPDLPLRLVSLHAPATIASSYSKTVKEILSRLESLPPCGDLVIGGDFNLTVGERHPNEPMGTSPADREIQHRLRDDFHLMNCWQTDHPNEPLAQTLRWARNRATPYHCDGIFVPESWKPRLQSCDVLHGSKWESLSDHFPVVAKFRAG